MLGSRWVKGGEVRELAEVTRGPVTRREPLDPNRMLGIPLRDATGGYRAFRRKTLLGLGLDNVASAGYCFQVDLAWRALKCRVSGRRGADHLRRAGVRRLQDEPANRRRGTGPNHVWGVAHRAKQLRALATRKNPREKALAS